MYNSRLSEGRFIANLRMPQLEVISPKKGLISVGRITEVKSY